MKNVIKIFIFLIGLNSIIYGISYTLISKNGNWLDYFKDKEELDVIWLGPSTTYFSISPMYIWNKYKITSFNNAHTAQRLTSIYLLNDVNKYNPKLVFFDITTFLMISPNLLKHHKMADRTIYKWFLSMYSRYQFLQDTNMGYKDLFYFMLLNIFHKRWQSMESIDFINNSTDYYFLGNDLSVKIIPQISPKIVTNEYLLNEEHIYVFDKLIKYVQNLDMNIVLWCPPTAKQDIYEYSLLVEDLFKKYNIPYINFNKIYKDINLNFNSDFLNQDHINIYGGEKVSDYLIDYALKNYNIKPHDNDPAYSSWNEDYIRYARVINRKEMRGLKSFKEWQNLAYYDNYTIFISTNGDNVLNRLPQTMKDKFKSLGLNKFETDKKNLKYAAIIDNNQVFFEEVSDRKVEYKGRMKKIVNLLVSSEHNKATMNVSGKPRAKNKYGINFVIYDKFNREIVDSIWVDPAQPDVVRR